MRSMVVVAGLAASLLVGPVPAAGTASWSADPADRSTDGASWTVELSTVDGDDFGVLPAGAGVRLDDRNRAGTWEPGRTGVLTTEPHRLDTATDRITASVDATVPAGGEVLVDVRGRGADGGWSEWTPAGRPLTEPAAVVQARVTLRAADGGGPVVNAVRLTAAEPTGTDAVRNSAPLTFRLFATREGLVGHTTANGHVIVERDHFVALPSRRGLSGRDDGEYSVRVCADNGRCAWEPVWDVGPWNTKDDHWNPPGTREMWGDLPHGRPQAQAAHDDGYNGGRDQYGRVVRNPAGIDLADGAFWDGLLLTTNSWVSVTYLWTGGGATVGTVTTGGVPLPVHPTPDTQHQAVGLAGNHAKVHVECQLAGQSITGPQGTSSVWLRISPDKYVPKAYVAAPDAPAC